MEHDSQWFPNPAAALFSKKSCAGRGKLRRQNDVRLRQGFAWASHRLHAISTRQRREVEPRIRHRTDTAQKEILYLPRQTSEMGIPMLPVSCRKSSRNDFVTAIQTASISPLAQRVPQADNGGFQSIPIAQLDNLQGFVTPFIPAAQGERGFIACRGGSCLQQIVGKLPSVHRLPSRLTCPRQNGKNSSFAPRALLDNGFQPFQGMKQIGFKRPPCGRDHLTKYSPAKITGRGQLRTKRKR